SQPTSFAIRNLSGRRCRPNRFGKALLQHFWANFLLSRIRYRRGICLTVTNFKFSPSSRGFFWQVPFSPCLRSSVWRGHVDAACSYVPFFSKRLKAASTLRRLYFNAGLNYCCHTSRLLRRALPGPCLVPV